MLSTLSVEDVCSADLLVSIKGKLDDLKQTMTTRTMLWLQYLGMVSIPSDLSVRSTMPVCASINETMQKFIGFSYETSDQHNDVSPARQARDVSDTVDLIDYLNERDPYVQIDSLFNIANGMTAQGRVNVEKAREIGVEIVESMAGKSTDEFTFRKANQAVTPGSRSTVKIKGEHVNVDPQLLFQRLLKVRERCNDVASLFQYELCPYPADLFE